MLFGGSHLVGVATFMLVLGAWQVPYFLRTNLECSIAIWVNNAAQRFEDNARASTLLRHLAKYPFEVLVCMLPWSLLLLRYADRRVLATLGSARANVLFLTTAIVVTFPSVWLASTAKGRYYMPLYPCFAVLIGIVIDRCLAADPVSHLRTVWRHYAAIVAGGLAIAGTVVAVSSWAPIGKLEAVAQPSVFAAVYLAFVLIGAIVMLRSVARPEIALVVLACLLGLTSTGVVVNAYTKKANDASEAVAALKRQLPQGKQLASFGRIDHLFAYLYETPIEYCPVPKTVGEVGSDVRYFAIDGGPKPIVKLPFAWEPVTTIVLDRNKMPKPARTVIIGRRIEESMAKNAAKPQAVDGPRR
jgi:hypothetical protein